MNPANLFNDIPVDLSDEVTQEILKSDKIRIERIISKGHYSPKNFWYDQNDNEWVVLLKGKAKLLFKEDEQTVILNPGDYINIPAHSKHRVEWTEPEIETIWLAVFY